MFINSMTILFQVDITYPNGQAASYVNVTLIMMWANGTKLEPVRTDEKGQAIASFTTDEKETTIRFKVGE